MNLLLLNRYIKRIIQGGHSLVCFCWFASGIDSTRCPWNREVKNSHIHFAIHRNGRKTKKLLAEIVMRPSKLSRISCESKRRASLNKKKKEKLLWCLEAQRQKTWNKHTDPGFSSLCRWWSQKSSGPGWFGGCPLFSSLCGCSIFTPCFVAHDFRGGQESWRVQAVWESFWSVALSMFNLAHPPYLNQH